MSDLEAECRDILDTWRYEAAKCADPEKGPIHGTEYARGVSAGLNHAADALEELLEEHREVKELVEQMEDAT